MSDEDKLDKILVTVTEIKTNCPHCVRRTNDLETEVYGKESYKGLKSRVSRIEWMLGAVTAVASVIGGLIVTAATAFVGWLKS